MLVCLFAFMLVCLYACMLVNQQSNSLTGSIPSSLGSLTGLQQLDLNVSVDSLDVVFGLSRDWAYRCRHTNKESLPSPLISLPASA
jgi:hypothetical protein